MAWEAHKEQLLCLMVLDDNPAPLLSSRGLLSEEQLYDPLFPLTQRAIFHSRYVKCFPRVRAGLQRARLEGVRIGRPPKPVDREAIRRDRQQGLSLNELARAHHLSQASVCKILKQAEGGGHKGCVQPPPQPS